MCVSATMAAISFAGTAISAVGAYQQQQAAANSARNQATYAAGVARNNAIIAGQNAADIRDRGAVAEADHRQRINQSKGSAKAVQASNGFLVDDTADSTNVQLVADLAEAGELDILRIHDNTEREARRAQIQGDQFTSDAGLLDMEAASQGGGSALGFGATLLGGATKAYGVYNT